MSDIVHRDSVYIVFCFLLPVLHGPSSSSMLGYGLVVHFITLGPFVSVSYLLLFVGFAKCCTLPQQFHFHSYVSFLTASDSTLLH